MSTPKSLENCYCPGQLLGVHCFETSGRAAEACLGDVPASHEVSLQVVKHNTRWTGHDDPPHPVEFERMYTTSFSYIDYSVVFARR